VRLADGRDVEVDGLISFPFGEFQGSVEGPDGDKRRTLVYLPSHRVIATLRSARQAKALAAELAPVWLRDRELATEIAGRHERESV